MGINIKPSFDFNIDLRSHALERQQRDRELFLHLVKDLNYSKDAAAYIIQKQRETGEYDPILPNFSNDVRTQEIRSLTDPNYMPQTHPSRPVPLPPLPDIPERSAIIDFKPANREAIAVFDAQDPRDINFLPVPEGVSKVHSVVQYDKPAKPGIDPRVKIAQNLFLEYAKNGFATDAQYEMMKTAGPFLGLTTEEIPTPENPTPPNFFQKIMGIAPDQPPASPTVVPKFPGKNGKSQTPLSPAGAPAGEYATAEDVRTAFRAGKLPRDAALKILRTQFGHQ